MKLSTSLPRSVCRQLPTLAELAGELAEALTGIEVRGMPERLDPSEPTILRDRGTDDARQVPGAIATLRNRAHSSARRAERESDPALRAEHEARAVMFAGRADALEHGRPIPLEWQTPSERLEGAIRNFAAAGLALAEELGEAEVPAVEDLEELGEALTLEEPFLEVGELVTALQIVALRDEP